MNEKVDEYIARQKRWKEEVSLLRNYMISMKELDEAYKWMHPCYTLQGKNIVIIQDFKNYCALLFTKGALMKDAEGMLTTITENVQAARQMRFDNIDQIKNAKKTITQYTLEAITIEKAGKKVAMKKTADYAVPVEFQQQLDKDANLGKAFEALTPGRQRGYLFHFGQPKKTETREARVIKNIPRILDGKGLDD